MHVQQGRERERLNGKVVEIVRTRETSQHGERQCHRHAAEETVLVLARYTSRARDS